MRMLGCTRCGVPLTLLGTRYLSDNPVMRGGLLDWFPNEAFEVYYCPECGKAEFYLTKGDAPAEFAAEEGTDADPTLGHVGEETECLECGAKIGPEETRCPQCGWSWK